MFILITENFIEIEYNDKEYLEKTSKDLSDTYVQKALFQNKKNKIWKLILWPLQFNGQNKRLRIFRYGFESCRGYIEI